MPREAKYVAVHDVSDARERRRLAGVLEGFGLRVQESAFELRLTPAGCRTLLRRVEALQLQSGFLYLYRPAGGSRSGGVSPPGSGRPARSHHQPGPSR